MLSPVGRNSLFCCSRFVVHLSDIVSINNSFVRARYHSLLSPSLCRTVLLELLFVRFGYFSLSYFSHVDTVYAIDYICRFKISGLYHINCSEVDVILENVAIANALQLEAARRRAGPIPSVSYTHLTLPTKRIV